MQRRALLAAIGTAAVAGCVADESPAGTEADTDTSETPDGDPATTTEHPTTATPETPDVGVSPSEAAGPPWDDDIEHVVAWPDVTDETPIALTPSTQQGSLPTTTFEFTLTNETDVRFDTNFYAWRVWKRVDGSWFHVAPTAWPQPLMALEPGESHMWTLTVDNTKSDGAPFSHVEGRQSILLSGLGGGTYAFTTDGWFATEDYQNGLGFAARFDLSGDPVELTPTDEVTETTREGDTVVVNTDREAGGDARKAAYIVDRVAEGESSDGAARGVITEQILRNRELRNTLPFFEDGVETVRLEEQNATFPAFGINDPRLVEYEGVRYRITAEELEQERETENGG
jgi:hypothetical protein